MPLAISFGLLAVPIWGPHDAFQMQTFVKAAVDRVDRGGRRNPAAHPRLKKLWRDRDASAIARRFARFWLYSGSVGVSSGERSGSSILGGHGSISGGGGTNFSGRGGRTSGGDCGMMRFGFSGGMLGMTRSRVAGPGAGGRFLHATLLQRHPGWSEGVGGWYARAAKSRHSVTYGACGLRRIPDTAPSG